MCDLQRFYNDFKKAVLDFRLDLCCFVFSVRDGILLCGYFNAIADMICLIAVSTGAFPPLMMSTQLAFMEGEYVVSTCAFAYSADLCLAVLLLCAMYRKDTILLRYYTYCGLAMLASTVLVYSMVIGVMTMLHTCVLVISLTYQVYIILLVRSVIVELKHEAEKLDYFYQNYPDYWKHDIEAPGDYPLETYYIYSPASSRRNSEILTAINVPKQTDKEPVDTIELKTKENKKKKKEAKGFVKSKPSEAKENAKEQKKKEVQDTVKPKTSEAKENTKEQKKKEVKDNVEPKPSDVAKDTTEPKASKPDEDIQPSTSKIVTGEKSKTDAVSETSEKPKALRYPYKFIAIKVPKEESIKEEKENEEKEKEAEKGEVKETKDVVKQESAKEVVKEQDTKEVVKEEAQEAKEEVKLVKKQKRSIFGRKKSKSDDNKTKDIDKKN